MEAGRSIGAVFREAIGHIQEIIRSEIRLAKAEIREEASKAKRGAILFGSGAILGLFAFGLVLLSAVYFIAIYTAPWIAALAVGVVVAIVSAMLISAGRKHFKETNVVPERTARTIKEDVQWVRQRTT